MTSTLNVSNSCFSSETVSTLDMSILYVYTTYIFCRRWRPSFFYSEMGSPLNPFLRRTPFKGYAGYKR